MTDPMMHLRALVGKAPDVDVLREMIPFADGRLMDAAEPHVLAYMSLETMAPVSDNPVVVLSAVARMIYTAPGNRFRGRMQAMAAATWPGTQASCSCQR